MASSHHPLITMRSHTASPELLNPCIVCLTLRLQLSDTFEKSTFLIFLLPFLMELPQVALSNKNITYLKHIYIFQA